MQPTPQKCSSFQFIQSWLMNHSFSRDDVVIFFYGGPEICNNSPQNLSEIENFKMHPGSYKFAQTPFTMLRIDCACREKPETSFSWSKNQILFKIQDWRNSSTWIFNKICFYSRKNRFLVSLDTRNRFGAWSKGCVQFIAPRMHFEIFDLGQLFGGGLSIFRCWQKKITI